MSTQITLDLPEDLLMNEQEIKMVLAINLYQSGKLSLGQAASLVKYSKQAFMEILGHQQISIFTENINEIKQDMQNAANYCR